MGLRLPGRGEKIHEMVCRCGGLVPIREVWRARKDDRDDSNGPGRQRDPRDSEHLEKELEAARRASRRQAAPFAKDRPQGRGGRPGRRAGAEYGRHGRRREPTQADETHVMIADRTTLSIAKAGELVGVTRRTIYNWIAGGKVEYVRTAGGSVRIFVDTLWRDPHAGVTRPDTPQTSCLRAP